ncbi:hypothetical protein GCK32_001024, partial [Trichostrongylus colubriformis]
MDEFIESVREKYHKRRWWTARWMDKLSKKTEIDKDTLAIAIFAVVGLICALTKQARICCNSILIVMPLIFTFGYPEECAPRNDMIIYWVLFGVFTLCDTTLEKIPLYYDFKLLLALLLFVEPVRLIDKIRELIYGKNAQESRIFNKNEMDTLKKSKRSPRPEKPDSGARTRPSPPSSSGTSKELELQHDAGGGKQSALEAAQGPKLPDDATQRERKVGMAENAYSDESKQTGADSLLSTSAVTPTKHRGKDGEKDEQQKNKPQSTATAITPPPEIQQEKDKLGGKGGKGSKEGG